jgi:hypothetical protein
MKWCSKIILGEKNYKATKSFVLKQFDNPNEKAVDGDVDAHDVGHLQSTYVESVVDETQDNEERDDDCQRLVHVESNLHDAVVNVGLVCLKHASSPQFPLDGHSDDINAR